jgi:hypothetical protein
MHEAMAGSHRAGQRTERHVMMKVASELDTREFEHTSELASCPLIWRMIADAGPWIIRLPGNGFIHGQLIR